MEALNKINNTTELDSLISATVPKKRGRPTKPNKIVKIPSGRGRGRPSKNASTNVIKVIQKGSNVETLNVESNDKCSSAPEENTLMRGRPHKLGRGKLAHSIVATGKGRGRPKKNNKEDTIGRKHRIISKRASTPTSGQNRGRPRKQNSDDESSEEKKYYEGDRRSVGRPRTGSLDLNIEKTGRGQGRPKKNLAGKRSITSIVQEALTLPKKRGRPSGVGRKSTPPSNACSEEEFNDLEPAMSNVSCGDSNEHIANSGDEKNNED